ncbi:MAG: YjgB family protein [Ramlibacter sp.]|nr:YjgB family protein [Ramlibacter sp.]MCY7318929.1 YjgB family protein [Ramlibacter sp.]
MALRFSVLALRAAGAAVIATWLLAGCDPQRISELEEGVASEADVRARFGEPEKIWDGAAGARILEYNRQPAGQKNYMITIDPGGRMSALRQVLNPANFERIQPGMMMEEVRRTLGKPAKAVTYSLKNETAWDWRYLQLPNTSMVFTVWFDSQYRVLRTSTGPDPDAMEHMGK